jgi:subtilisin family serine protease
MKLFTTKFSVLFLIGLILSVVSFPVNANGPEISFLQIQKIHQSGITGKGFSVAIIDDGLDTTHPYFAGADILGVNINADGTATIGRDAARKFGSHGQGAAGVIVGQTSSATNNIVVYGDPVFGGWAPGAKLIFISYDQYGSQRLGQERAFDWITNNYQKYNIVAVSLAAYSYNARTYLPPCGGRYFPIEWERSINNLLNTPVALVNAEGNMMSVDGNYPGCLDKAISVAAYQDPEVNQPVSWTNLSPRYNSIIAPCCYVSASQNGSAQNGWENYGGTSSAAPVVAAIFALANQARPGVTREEVIAAMRETARPIRENSYIFPILDIAKFFARLADKNPINTNLKLHGALNYYAMPSPTPTPAPTVTITATPTPAPKVTSTASPKQSPVSSKITINCAKGNQIKKITGVKPSCPSGYKRK